MNLARKCFRRKPSRPPDAPTVFVVDSDASVRQALEVLIRSAGWLPNMAASAEEFMACPPSQAPCCLLAELQPPGLTGLELQRLVFDRPELPVIFIGKNLDVQAAVRAMKGGAFDVLVTPSVPDVTLAAIRQAIERSRSALNDLAHIKALRERYASLTAREREVMSLVVSGRLNKQVGGDLGIREVTVKVHRGKIMRKMRARSLAELVNMAASLRRWTAALGLSLHLPPEPLTETDSFVQFAASAGSSLDPRRSSDL
jgi:FixJ family two-component response regulator